MPVADGVQSVSELVLSMKDTIEAGYGSLRLRGEVSNLRQPGSGHLYFALREVFRDEEYLVRCVMWRSSARDLRIAVEDGLEVEVGGYATIYPQRGDLQVIARSLRPSGLGALMQAFRALRDRLEQEGLFAPERKRPLPALPRTVGLVTSSSGAAVRDLTHVLGRRWPLAKVVLAPVRVQGEGASLEIAAALRRLERETEADVIIVGRGGGSLEDLWAFNEEPVARAIAACGIPVVSAVGHETDTTIADLVADVRAATPSAAAELVVPDQADVIARLHLRERALARALRDRLETGRGRLDALTSKYGFRYPERFLDVQRRKADEAHAALGHAVRDRLREARARLDRCRERLAPHQPQVRLVGAREDVGRLHHRLLRHGRGTLAEARRRVGEAGASLRALDPTAVLRRGYAVVFDPATGALVPAARELRPDEAISVQFFEDRVTARVETVESEPMTWNGAALRRAEEER